MVYSWNNLKYRKYISSHNEDKKNTNFQITLTGPLLQYEIKVNLQYRRAEMLKNLAQLHDKLRRQA